MNARSVYSKSLKTDDFKAGEPKILTIDKVRVAKFQDQADKLELAFAEIEKTLLLNVSNNDYLCERLGPETDEWPGAVIRLSLRKLDRPFKGNTHSIYISGARFAVPPTPQKKVVEDNFEAPVVPSDDDIPF